MKTLKERIKMRLDALGMTKAEFARRLGVEPQYINNWEARDSLPKDRSVQAGEILKCSAFWLTFGGGPAGFEESPTNEDMAAELELLQNDAGDQKVQFQLEYVFIPLFDKKGDITTNILMFKKKWIEQKVGDSGDPVVASVSGDAMAPRIQDGDIVLIDRNQNTIEDGKIYAIKMGDTLIYRRLTLDWDGSVSMQSNTTTQPDKLLTAKQAKELQIFGRAIWVAGDL